MNLLQKCNLLAILQNDVEPLSQRSMIDVQLPYYAKLIICTGGR